MGTNPSENKGWFPLDSGVSGINFHVEGSVHIGMGVLGERCVCVCVCVCACVCVCGGVVCVWCVCVVCVVCVCACVWYVWCVCSVCVYVCVVCVVCV